MKAITTADQNKLETLYSKYCEVRNSSALNAHGRNDTPSDKRTQTLRFNKFFGFAKSLGYDMLSTIPECMNPNNA